MAEMVGEPFQDHFLDRQCRLIKKFLQRLAVAVGKFGTTNGREKRVVRCGGSARCLRQ
jgi:hypothetical protein